MSTMELLKEKKKKRKIPMNWYDFQDTLSEDIKVQESISNILVFLKWE